MLAFFIITATQGNINIKRIIFRRLKHAVEINIVRIQVDENVPSLFWGLLIKQETQICTK